MFPGGGVLFGQLEEEGGGCMRDHFDMYHTQTHTHTHHTGKDEEEEL